MERSSDSKLFLKAIMDFSRLRSFCSFAPSSLLWGRGGWGIIVPFFILSKIVWGPHWRYKKLYLLCRSHLICCRTFDNQEKRTLAEIKSDDLCERLKQNWHKIKTWFIFGASCTLLIWKLNMDKCVLKRWPKAKFFLQLSGIYFYCWYYARVK